MAVFLAAAAVGGLFGSGSSPQAARSPPIIDVEVLTQKVTSILTKTTNNISTSNMLVNTVTIDNKGVIDCGPGGLNVNQLINANMKNINSINDQVTNDIKTEITSTITSYLEQNGKKIERAVGTNSGITVPAIKNRVTNIINTTVTTDVINNIINLNQITNDYLLKNNGYISGDQCNINQNIQAQIISNNLIQNIIENLLHDSTLNQVDSQLKQTTQNNTNPGGKNKSGGLTIFLIILGIIIALGLVIGLIYYFSSRPKTSNKISTDSNRSSPIKSPSSSATEV